MQQVRENSGVAPWWRPQRLDLAENLRLRLGPLTAWLTRSAHEWRLAWRRGDDPQEDSVALDLPHAEIPPEQEVESRRFAFGVTTPDLRFEPLLADRPVIVGAVEALSLPPGEAVTLYVGTSIWLRLILGGKEVWSEPVFRPSDTWFGPSTRTGELCYSGRTRARLDLAELPLRQHRAITTVTIRNRAADFLAVERLRIPLPNLSLFLGRDGRLWTEAITLNREDEGERASIDLDKGPPSAAGAVELLTGPRQQPDRLALVRVFSGILRGKGGSWTDFEF